MSKFINPFSDAGFKRLFGQETCKPVLIGFLNALLEGEQHIVSLDYRDKEQLGIRNDKLRFIYLQLPLFQKQPEDCETLFEKIIYTLKDMDILHRRPDLFSGPIFSKIASISDVASLTKEERERYDIYLRQYRDTIAVLEGQYEEGMAEGMEKGMAEGMEKGKKEGLLIAARQMRLLGVSDANIIEHLGLTSADMAQL